MRKLSWIPSLLVLLGLSGCIHGSSSGNLSDVLSSEQTEELLKADVILLGEQHDNPHHHRIQEQVIELLGRANVLGDLIFEQVNWDQQPILNQLNNRNLAELRTALNWDKSGWPDFAFYEPLFVSGIRFRAPMIAGNIAADKSKAIYKDGYGVIFKPEEQRLLGLQTELEPQALEALRKEVYDGHCQMIPPDHVNAMIPIQRSRDAAMALAWHRLHKQGKSVFIVGSGHSRKDFGIPWYLKKLKPELRIYSIGMNETGSQAEAEVFDQVITTAAAEREDQCEGLKKKWPKKG